LPLLLLLLQGELIINEDLNVYDITHSSVQVRNSMAPTQQVLAVTTTWY
jgi:hypothetical protein